MKKIILGLLILATTFASCTDQEEIEITYQTSVSVSASQIFDSFQPVQSTDFDMMTGWGIHIHSFVYDAQGNLAFETNSLFDDIDSPLNYNLQVSPGQYTIVSVANFEGEYNNVEYKYWDITETSNINTFTVTECEPVLSWAYETLSMSVTEVEVSNSAETIKINLQPVTALIQLEVHYDDLTGYGYNGYSMYMPTCTLLKILADTRTQTIKIDTNHDYVYGYIESSAALQNVSWNPSTTYSNGGALTILSYRAFLPEENKTFKWSWTHDYSDYGWGIITETSENTTPVNFESGKQYDMDLVLDIPYLFVEEHDPQRDWRNRVNDYISNQ